jgi:hypothetical protein
VVEKRGSRPDILRALVRITKRWSTQLRARVMCGTTSTPVLPFYFTEMGTSVRAFLHFPWPLAWGWTGRDNLGPTQDHANDFLSAALSMDASGLDIRTCRLHCSSWIVVRVHVSSADLYRLLLIDHHHRNAETSQDHELIKLILPTRLEPAKQPTNTLLLFPVHTYTSTSNLSL